jgi:dodecin
MPAARKTRQSKSQQKSDRPSRASAGRKSTTRADSPSREPKIYKQITVTATSPVGYSDAVRVAIAKARDTVRSMSWWEVVDQRGRIDPASCEIEEYQLTLAIHFLVD